MSDLREKIAGLIDHDAWIIRPQSKETWGWELRQGVSLTKADAIIALLPPAPDGATEGWRMVPVGEPCELGSCPPGLFQTASGGMGFMTEYADDNAIPRSPDAYVVESGEYWWGGHKTRFDRDSASVQPLALAPPVSPVRPKGEEDEQFIARIIANHMMDEFEWPRSLAERTGATLAATIIWANPSQPTQTGEENAGLVEDAATDVEALEKQATRIIFEAMPRPECCQPGCTITPGVHPDCGCYMDAAIIAYDLRHLLAPRSPIPGGALQNQLTRNPGELAATNPIPGELKALSDAAPAGEPLIDIVADAWAAGFEGASFFEVDQEKLHFNAFEYAKNRLAKTHQVAEGGETS